MQNDAASESPARILIIDGDKNSRKTAVSLLTANGYSVDAVTTGGEAITKTKQTRYNLLLIATVLPDMAGNKLLNRIHETIPKTKKIMLATNQTLQDALSAVNHGADSYILKPFDKAKMLAAVEAQLGKQELKISRQHSRHANVLFIGAHPDDIELGCGGTLVKHIQNGDNTFAVIFTNGEKGVTENDLKTGVDRQQETLTALKLAGVPLSNIYFLQYPDTELWQHRQKVMNTISKFCETFQIHLVYTHSNKAQHQDHVTIYDETMRGAKKAWGIMAYESHGATNPSFSPNMFVDITDVIPKKIAMLNCHQSQISKNYFQVESIIALAQFRSSQSEEFHYAEAFEIIKMNITSRSQKEFSVRDLLKVASSNGKSIEPEAPMQGLPFQL
jgi:LmbE family N-acetylglucosaminyl deacetylase/CheY-like chemotaxis protein